MEPVPILNAGTVLTVRRLLKSHPSSSIVRLPVDKPALASIMTHDHAKGLCASELGLLRI